MVHFNRKHFNDDIIFIDSLFSPIFLLPNVIKGLLLADSVFSTSVSFRELVAY